MGDELVKRMEANAEDICLLVGTLAASVGVGLAFGYAFGLIALGVLLVAYGVWISPRPHKEP